MPLAVSPDWVPVAGVILGIIGVIGGVVGGLSAAFGARAKTVATQQDQIIDALEARVNEQKRQIEELHETAVELRGAVKALQEMVTARDMIRRGFVYLNVPEHILEGKG